MKSETLVKSNGHNLNGFTIDDIGDDHLYTGLETPMKKAAFEMTNAEKKERISILFSEIMDVLGLDLTDDSLKGTPDRVAKMYIEEIFSGLDPKNKPKIALLTISISTTKCLWKRTLHSIRTVNITLCRSLVRHMLPTFLQVR
jgi:GTP cyclohydrolase I